MKHYLLFLILLLLGGTANCSDIAGVRIGLNNTFLKDTARILIPKGLEAIQQLIAPPNEFQFSMNFWPLYLGLKLQNFTSTSFSQDPTFTTFEAAPGNKAYFLRIPLIRRWDIDFKYEYNSSFGQRVAKKAYLHFESFNFSVEFKIKKTWDSFSLQILALNVQMGNTEIYFENAPFLLSLVQLFVNRFQWLYSFALNFLGRDPINLLLSFVPLKVELPLLGSYALDAGLTQDIEMNKIFSKIYVHSEIFNQGKNIRGDVDTPTDLSTITSEEKFSLEVLFNEYLFSTAFSSMAKSGDLFITLNDSQIFNLTGLLHLRTSNFRYYIPTLMKYGDRPISLTLKYYNNFPKVLIGRQPNELGLSFDMSADFNVEGVGSVITLRVVGDGRISLSLKGKELKGKLVLIELSKVEVIKNIDKPDPDMEELRKEFNSLFSIVANGVNIYALEKPIHIPEKIPLGFVTLHIDSTSLKIVEGALALSSVFSISE